MLSLRSCALALAGVALAGCGGRGGLLGGILDDEGDPPGVEAGFDACEAREATPVVDRVGAPGIFLLGDEPGWRYEPLTADDDGVLAARTRYNGDSYGELLRWTDGDGAQTLAALPANYRISALVRGPEAIYAKATAARPSSAAPAILAVRDGATTLLQEVADLGQAPVMVRSDDALFAQSRSGAFLKIPLDGGPALAFSPAVTVATLEGDALYLLRTGAGEDELDRLVIERQDLATGKISALSRPFCVDEDVVGGLLEPSAIVVKDGVPFLNTRRAIATLDAGGARVDRFRVDDTDLRGLRLGHDGVYFFRGHTGSGSYEFYRLAYDEGDAEQVARFSISDPAAEVTGWAAIPGALYVAFGAYAIPPEIWRVALE